MIERGRARLQATGDFPSYYGEIYTRTENTIDHFPFFNKCPLRHFYIYPALNIKFYTRSGDYSKTRSHSLRNTTDKLLIL